MKRTIDSYFKATAADSSKNSDEKASSSPSAELTELEEEENCVIESSNLLSVESSTIKERHYNIKWEKKYKWLVYNEEKKGAFCKLCQNFMKNDLKVLQKTGGVFITIPFTSYKNALGKNGKLEKHEHSSAHTVSIEMEKIKNNAMKKPIHTQIVQQSDSEIQLNRKSLKILLRGLYFLVKEEIAHTTKYGSLIESIFDKLNDDFKTWRKSQSDRSNYSSKDTACELLVCMGEMLRNVLKKTLKNKKFSILADETFGFDGAANMAGNVGGVRRKLSEKAKRDILYIHCKAHILSLAAASCRNKNKKVNRFFYVLKDIYKLFSKSPKRENILHEIQAVINDPILKIPECIEVRWLSHYKIVNAVFRSLKSIMMACEHIHKDGIDLASLAGGILLEIRKTSFFITCYVMNELLSTLSYLSNTLQKKNLNLANVIPLITTTKLHLNDIANQCVNTNSNLYIKIQNEIHDKFGSEMHLTADEDTKTTLKQMKEYCESLIREIDNRFNDKSINIMKFASHFESFQSFIGIQDTELKIICGYFPMLNAEAILADIKSFNFFIKSMLDSGIYKAHESPLIKIMEADIGYTELQQLCEILLVIPVTT
ncbi:zinc finger protein 862-like, partial [Aphis craccivora]